MVRVKARLAQARKMFGRAQDIGRPQSSQEFSGINNRLFWVRRNRTRTHYHARRLEC